MILSNARIVTGEHIIEKGIIEIEGNIITKVYESDDILGTDLQGLTVFPGFIDMHTHGSNGVDFMDYHKDINIIFKHALVEGVTSLLATTMTQTPEHINKALRNIASYNDTYSKLLGIHLEGPFLNKAYNGAQQESLIIPGDIELFNQFQQSAKNKITLVTVAIEHQSDAFIKTLQDDGVIISVGHSNANAEEMKKAVAHGIHRVTHCYNAMSKFHHRDIGVVGSTLLYDEITPELISDNFHVSDDAIKLLYKLKKDNIILITDSMEAKNLGDGLYSLGGQQVEVRDNKAFIKDTIAGSTLRFSEAIQNMKRILNLNDIELSKMTSYNQAKQLHLEDRLGKIQPSFTADLTIVDQDYNVKYTIVDGEIKFKNED